MFPTDFFSGDLWSLHYTYSISILGFFLMNSGFLRSFFGSSSGTSEGFRRITDEAFTEEIIE